MRYRYLKISLCSYFNDFSEWNLLTNGETPKYEQTSFLKKTIEIGKRHLEGNSMVKKKKQL